MNRRARRALWTRVRGRLATVAAWLAASPAGDEQTAPVVHLNLPPPWKVSDTALMRSKGKLDGMVPVIFKMPDFPKSVVPAGLPKELQLANDEQIIEANAWAAQSFIGNAFVNGVTFMGYPELSAMAQRPEYRRVSEVLATEATRKWIALGSTSTEKTPAGEDPKAERLSELTAEMARLDIQGAFRRMIELDGFFGRAHLYLDTGSTDDRSELLTPIGTGRDQVTLNKFGNRKGFLKAVKPVEPVWCYPAKYNASDPLKPDWYDPQSWFVQGKELHCTRLLTFVGREVPDLLKPSYSFGGLALSQMVKPYVDNWLRTRQAVADLIWSFSVRGIKTDLSTAMAADGDELFRRMALFANIQTNQGLMVLDKDKEEFFNIATPLGSLDALQGQSQEHMCSVSGTPVVKLLGIQPAGLNASSEGELTVWYDWVEAFQEKFISARLKVVMDFVMLSLWGEIDEDITFTFESLRALTEKELAEKRKTEAETDALYVEMGALSPTEVRERLATDPESPYDGLSLDDAPEGGEGEEGGDEPDLGSLIGQLGASEPRADRGRSREDGEERGEERSDRTRSRGGGRSAAAEFEAPTQRTPR